MKILKVRKKPIVVEALQWTGKNIEEVKDFLGEKYIDKQITLLSNPSIPVFAIKTLEGDMYINLGSYIIRGVEGEFWAIKESIFDKTYEILPAESIFHLHEERYEELLKELDSPPKKNEKLEKLMKSESVFKPTKGAGSIETMIVNEILECKNRLLIVNDAREVNADIKARGQVQVLEKILKKIQSNDY